MSSREGTRGQFNGRPSAIELGVEVHQAVYVAVCQEGGSNPKPPQRFSQGAFLVWAAKLKQKHPGAALHAVYEACGFGFGLQRQLSALGIACHVVAPQKLDERQQRVKTDGRDAKALCLKLDRFVEGNQEALAVVRVPSAAEEQARALPRQREQLVRTRKQLEAHGRSLLVNHGIEPVPRWWKGRAFAALAVPAWLRDLLGNTQPILLQIEAQIRALTVALQSAAAPDQPRGLGALTSVVIDREVCAWERFRNRRQIGSYTGLCPGEHSSGHTRLQTCITEHGNPRLRAALVELAWRMVRFQPDYRPVVKWRRILAKGALATGAARKKAIVAMARQLAVDLWRIRTGRGEAATLGLKI
ncbi:MAG: IS110 family transposase [Chthoniobacterales bacterium]|nr:IS110 family transposase [Chthoniobacterales bacterium]